jgi:hypothetical protein
MFVHCTLALALALLLSPVSALAGDDGNVASVTYWTVRDGHEEEFEAGVAAHNKIHADNNDPQAYLTWRIVSGKRNGQYLRASFGHDWADFDAVSEFAEADDADAAANVTPHIAKAEPVYGVALPDISNPPTGPSSLSQVVYFHVEPGKQAQFMGAVGKIHAALEKVEGGWRPYVWYELRTGSSPTFVVSLPSANWAGLARDERLMAAVAAEHGPEGLQKIMQAFGDAIEHEHSYISVFRADLSYIPAAD